MARSLADAGFVVIAYDRLGYGRSPYTGIGGPDALTVTAQQSALHDLVTALHAGSYQLGRALCRPGDPGIRTTYASSRVALIGHSAGGFVVSSYPGRYHDVVAMVQANAPSGLQSLTPPGNAAITSVIGGQSSPPHGAGDDRYGTVGDSRQDRQPPAAPRGYGYVPGPDRVPCEEFTLWRPTAVREVATVMCAPQASAATPEGEGNSYYWQAPPNNALIRQTGAIPVLLAGGDHDVIMPGDANALELSAWKGACGCDVSQFVLTDTAHAFMAHDTLPQWIDHAVTWLHAEKVR